MEALHLLMYETQLRRFFIESKRGILRKSHLKSVLDEAILLTTGMWTRTNTKVDNIQICLYSSLRDDLGGSWGGFANHDELTIEICSEIAFKQVEANPETKITWRHLRPLYLEAVVHELLHLIYPERDHETIYDMVCGIFSSRYLNCTDKRIKNRMLWSATWAKLAKEQYNESHKAE